ncbi:MAG TPA: MlaD family protein [Burkholderiales bacterium]|jgi:phospholipid/cholesterol/gamma-HCH transport system substrate-binding protein|nr:MlaD family protein [Burkholderiales bacterium]
MGPRFSPPVRFSRLVLKVNAFLLAALLLVAAFLGLVAYKQGWFVKQTPIHFVTANALGINKGMPVKLYGFPIGSVGDMRLSEDGVDVELSIINAYLPRIPHGSRAKFARESGVVGASVIEIIPGKSGMPVAAGERIDFEPSRGISEIIDDFRRQAVPAFNEIRQVLSQMRQSGEDVSATLAGLRREIDQLPRTHRALRALIEDAGDATGQVRRDASAALQAAQRASDSAERAATAVDRAVPVLSGKLVTTLDALEATSEQLRRTGAQAEETLRQAGPVLQRGETAAREASDVFSAAKRVWPISDSFKEGSERTLPIDSFDGYPR